MVAVESTGTEVPHPPNKPLQNVAVSGNIPSSGLTGDEARSRLAEDGPHAMQTGPTSH
jgi:hypothetical protein